MGERDREREREQRGSLFFFRLLDLANLRNLNLGLLLLLRPPVLPGTNEQQLESEKHSKEKTVLQNQKSALIV